MMSENISTLKSLFTSHTILDQLPCLCIFKDTNSKYIAFNQEAIQIAQLKNAEEVIGKSDFDMPWEQYATQYIAQDKLALQGKPSTDVLPSICADGSNILLLAKKSPVYGDNGKIMALVGISFHLTLERYSNIISLLATANLKFSDFLSTIKDAKKKYVYGNLEFSRRQAQVISALLKGYHAHQIAKELNLSVRTIEYYIEIIKNKLGCDQKNEIVAKAFHEGFIDLMFMNIV